MNYSYIPTIPTTEKRKRYNLEKISKRLSQQPRRLLEMRSKETHD